VTRPWENWSGAWKNCALVQRLPDNYKTR
jgi:hypothetical protein